MIEAQSPRSRLSGAVHQNLPFSRTGLNERMFSRMFTGLVYAQIWEDPVMDMDGLALTSEDHVVCISSGGCNLMSYLTAAPASVSAADLSPAHVALVRLKLAAACALPDHAAFYDLFGHANKPGNVALFDDYIAPVVDAETRDWWTGRLGLIGQRTDMFKRGLYRFGALGRFITTLHAVSRIAGVDYTPYFHSATLDDQAAFFDREVAPMFDKSLVRFIARRRASLFGLGIPPAQFDKLAADSDGDIVPVLLERTRKLMCDFPVSENYFAWAAFNRGYKSDGTGPVPPYLQACHWNTVRANAPRASIRNSTVTDLLAEAPDRSKTAYVLLDAQDWMTDAQLTDLWTQITRTAGPGARVLFRTGGAPDILPGRVPSGILNQWNSDPDEGKALWQQDRSAIYGGVHLYRLKD